MSGVLYKCLVRKEAVWKVRVRALRVGVRVLTWRFSEWLGLPTEGGQSQIVRVV
jgi:hypothetical protein